MVGVARVSGRVAKCIGVRRGLFETQVCVEGAVLCHGESNVQAM